MKLIQSRYDQPLQHDVLSPIKSKVTSLEHASGKDWKHHLCTWVMPIRAMDKSKVWSIEQSTVARRAVHKLQRERLA